jgi:DnaJ homolog subfamily A member 2
MEDIFFQYAFSGFDLGGGPRRRNKTEDSVHPYEVSLEDLYNGKTVKMNLERDVICSACHG